MRFTLNVKIHALQNGGIDLDSSGSGNSRVVRVHDVPTPVSLLVAVRVDREVVVVNLGVVDVTVHVNLIEYLQIGLIFAEASHLTPRVRCGTRRHVM